MSADYTSLCDLGLVALSHRAEVETIKAELGITHGYFDAWIYGFLENKKFDIPETVAKLRRRFDMERDVLSNYEITDTMRQSLRKGIIQEIGLDKQGRVAFYVFTKRDTPKAEFRDESRKTFDMFVSYGTRLRSDNKRSQMVMLINQEDSSFFKNIDISFQSDAALRIAKFYPGMIDKMYVCNMGSTLSMMAKPVLSRLPAVVSDRIKIITPGDIKKGALLENFDESVLPVALGGTNTCDTEAHWVEYAETVENYYLRLQTAVRDRGLTVKEWELEELGIDPSGPLKESRSACPPASLANSIHSTSNPSEPRPLVSCRSDYGPVDALAEEAEQNAAEWKDVFCDLDMHLALFFMDELLRWREATEDQEEVERYKIMHENATEFAALTQEENGLSLEVQKLYEDSRFPVVALAKFWMVVITILSSIYFVTALLFYALFAADVLATLYLGFFIEKAYYFPLSCAMIMVFYQGTALCTRALDVVYAIWRGRVIPPFERLGQRWGAIAEVIIFILITLLQVVVFCIYAAKSGPAVGLEYAFATAWLVAVCIIFLNHAFFFSGFFNKRDHSQRDKRVLHLPFFLALRSSSSEKQQHICGTSVVVCSGFFSTTVLLGVGFLISRIVSLYICTTVFGIITAYIVQFFCEELANSLSGLFMIISMWMFCVSWLFGTFVFGLQNKGDNWIWPVALACTVNGLFIVGGFFSLLRRKNGRFLRLLFLAALVYVVACWISSFPIVNWKVGVFTISLMVHNLLNMFLAPCNLTDCRASFLVASATVMVIVACLLLGWNGTIEEWADGDTLTAPVAAASTASLSSLEQFHQYPVCNVKIGLSGSTFSITDVSYLLELGRALLHPAVVASGINMWFSGRDVTHDGTTQLVSYDKGLYAQHFSSAAAGVGFSVIQEFSPWGGISSMALWVDTIALRPITILLPENWNSEVTYAMSFVSRMIPFYFRDAINNLEQHLSDTDRNKTILCAAGTAGGIAAAVSAKLGIQSIIFSAGGLRSIAKLIGVDDDAYHRYVLNINAVNGVASNYGGYDVTVSQRVWCSEASTTCISQSFMTTALQKACELHEQVDTS